DHYIVLQGRMAFSCFFSCSSQGHSLVKSYIIANDSCLSYDHSSPMIDKQPFTYFCPGMDFNTCFSGRSLRNPSGQEIMAFWIQQHLKRRFYSRVPFLYHLKFFFYMSDKAHLFTSILKKESPYIPRDIETNISAVPLYLKIKIFRLLPRNAGLRARLYF